MKSVRTMAVALSALLLMNVAAQANLLTNSTFQFAVPGDPSSSHLNGWSTFGNAFDGINNSGFVEDNTGIMDSGSVKMFGNFSGGFDVTGTFQEFSAAPGSVWTMNADSRHNSDDAIPGDGPNGMGSIDDNWAVMKIAFFDAANAEIGASEAIILDGTFATDVWHTHAPIMGVAPAGTTKVQGLLLYLQPGFDGGAGFFDNVSLVPEPSGLVMLLLGGLALLRNRR